MQWGGSRSSVIGRPLRAVQNPSFVGLNSKDAKSFLWQTPYQKKAIPQNMNWFFNLYRPVARILSWIGIIAIIVLSVVPANERPVTGVGHLTEHTAAFAL